MKYLTEIRLIGGTLVYQICLKVKKVRHMGNVLKAHALRYAQCTFKYLEKIGPRIKF